MTLAEKLAEEKAKNEALAAEKAALETKLAEAEKTSSATPPVESDASEVDKLKTELAEAKTAADASTKAIADLKTTGEATAVKLKTAEGRLAMSPAHIQLAEGAEDVEGGDTEAPLGGDYSHAAHCNTLKGSAKAAYFEKHEDEIMEEFAVAGSAGDIKE